MFRPILRDSPHDFDFEIGTWKTHVRRLAQETIRGRAIFVRFVISEIVNWIATDTRVKETDQL